MFLERGLRTPDHVDMAGFAVLWVEIPDRTRDMVAPVSALRYILVVSELEHEIVTCLCVLGSAESSGFHAFAEAIVWERWGDDVKCGP